jgi:pyruvate dehydrogenase E1 component alpha subunit
LYDLPCVFIIENNEFAMGTRLEYHAADKELWKRGLPFDIRSERIDGMDVIDMKRKATEIVEWCRKEQRPAWIEIMTYRYSGHGAADNDRQLYRTKEEEDLAWQRDPIARLKMQMITLGYMTEEKYEAIEEELIEEVERIYEICDASPFPEPDEVYDNIYSDMKPEAGH